MSPNPQRHGCHARHARPQRRQRTPVAWAPAGGGPARGFALLESLVAVVVIAVGLLALAATFTTLSRGQEVARHRGEATRLAQERIEVLRGFTSIDDASLAGLRWNDLASGNDALAGQATFTRTWTLSGSASDPMRLLNVQVQWPDRAGEVQQVTLTTVVSRTDPSDVGALGFPLPANTTLKRPKNRNLDIPLPASDLGNGESAFRLPGTSYAVIFSNDTGWVVKTCDLAGSGSTITLADLSNCSDTPAYLVAGYISLAGSAAFPSGLAMSTAGLSGTTSSTCSVSAATDPNTGATISAYRYFVCVVGVASSGASWSGRFALAAPTLQSGADRRVCRFQYAAAAGLNANQRNVQPYVNVNEPLTSQNYVITSAATCPTVGGLATTLHQTCAASNAARATDCPAS